MQEPDPRTLKAAQRGDLGAFDELVRMFQADLWRFCIGLLRDGTTAEDAVQETFLKAFRYLPGYKGRSKFSTWLFSIAAELRVRRTATVRPPRQDR